MCFLEVFGEVLAWTTLEQIRKNMISQKYMQFVLVGSITPKAFPIETDRTGNCWVNNHRHISSLILTESIYLHPKLHFSWRFARNSSSNANCAWRALLYEPTAPENKFGPAVCMGILGETQRKIRRAKYEKTLVFHKFSGNFELIILENRSPDPGLRSDKSSALDS